MSFILDALKKSEIERQRQAIPGLMDSGPPASRTRFPRWAAALVVLLGINLAVLLIVLMRGGVPTFFGSRSASPAAAVAHAPPVAAALPAPEHFSPMDAAPVYAPEVPADEAASAAIPARPLNRVPPSVSVTSPLRASHLRDPVLTADEVKSDDEVLPSINEIDLAGQQALPELHLDVHVFATKPAERFVYINMRKYREGATLAEGPILERIRRDGVVLNFHGLRFVLPRQQ